MDESVAKPLAVLYFISWFIVPFLIPLLVNKLMYTTQVTTPKREMEQRIWAKERESEPLKKKVEAEYGGIKTKLDEELRELESLLEKCRKRRYV